MPQKHKFKIGDKISIKHPGYQNYLYNIIGTIVDTLPGKNNLLGYEVKFSVSKTNNFHILMAENDIALIK